MSDTIPEKIDEWAESISDKLGNQQSSLEDMQESLDNIEHRLDEVLTKLALNEVKRKEPDLLRKIADKLGI